jgi:hypothetical protein
MDLLTLAKTLGHSKIQMVMRYVHPMEQHEAEAIERLERYNAEQRIAQAPAVSDAVQ